MPTPEEIKTERDVRLGVVAFCLGLVIGLTICLAGRHEDKHFQAAEIRWAAETCAQCFTDACLEEVFGHAGVIPRKGVQDFGHQVEENPTVQVSLPHDHQEGLGEDEGPPHHR